MHRAMPRNSQMMKITVARLAMTIAKFMCFAHHSPSRLNHLQKGYAEGNGGRGGLNKLAQALQ